jgi:DNA-binding GntR family transcriptional regulator
MMITEDNTAWLGRLRGAPLPVLLTLYAGGRLDQAQLARATGLKPQTVREALLLLELHGLVAPLRSGRWAITPEGDALVTRLQRRRGG